MAKRRRPKKRPRVIQKATALATVGAAGASAVLAARPPTPGLLGLATLLVGLFPLTFSLAMPQVAERRRLDIQRWWERATEPEDGQTQDAVWRYLEQNAGEPWVGETIAQATRSLLDALDESVVPVLGTLTRRYLRAERRPDRFFRDFSRFLADLSAEELAALRTVFDRAAPVIETLGPQHSLDIETNPNGSLRVSAIDLSAAQHDAGLDAIDAPEQWRSVRRLLAAHALAAESLGPGRVTYDGGRIDAWSIEREVARRILAALRP